MTEKKVFDRMLDPEVRKAFCEHKGEHLSEDNPEYKNLTDYILSDECEKDILRLKNGDYYIAVPVRFRIKKSIPKKEEYVTSIRTGTLMF